MLTTQICQNVNVFFTDQSNVYLVYEYITAKGTINAVVRSILYEILSQQHALMSDTFLSNKSCEHWPIKKTLVVKKEQRFICHDVIYVVSNLSH